MVTLVANFGGPRSLDEVPTFLKALLTDRDVIRTRLPRPLHHLLFTYVARKRARQIAPDYALIGGRSPIYFDTETLAQALPFPTLTLHRYLPDTHAATFAALEASSASEIRVLPLFPQFSYATTGSLARLLARHLSPRTLRKLRWIKSYATHPAFLAAWTEQLKPYADHALLFSAHGLPQAFADAGDPYPLEVQDTVRALPFLHKHLSYQSKFGKGEWLRPYTDEMCCNPTWTHNRPVAIVPISFTSDHIETLYEIEHLYLPLLRAQGLTATRISPPPLTAALAQIADTSELVPTQMLIRL